jgi:DNA polymerase III delta subunit
VASRAGADEAAGLIEAARAGGVQPLYLVAGDRPLAEPAALRLAAGLAATLGVEPVPLRHPEDLAGVVQDLRTYSLFATGKIVVAIESGVLADREAAAGLLAAARAELPFTGGPEALVGRARDAALALLRVLRLFDLEGGAEAPERHLARLPDALFGAARSRGRRAAAETGEDPRAALVPLLAAAAAAGLRGVGETEVSLVADLLRDGLPAGHALVLVESAVAEGHPIVETLRSRGALLEAGWLEAERGGRVAGLDRLVVELQRETGARIDREAAQELARRTLRSAGRRGGEGEIDADSTERFGAEFRKLAALSGEAPIAAGLVRDQVEDRGEEDVWQILDAVATGEAGTALARLERRLAGAEDPALERLAVFGLLAAFARQVVALRGAARATGVRGGEASYPRFKAALAPELQGAIDGIAKNPLAGIHPFRLHRVYLAASRFAGEDLERLPAEVLETERRMKGDSGDAGAALAGLLLRLAAPAAPLRPAGGAAPGSRAGGAAGGRS